MQKLKRCPRCKVLLFDSAAVCDLCGYSFQHASSSSATHAPPPSATPSNPTTNTQVLVNEVINKELENELVKVAIGILRLGCLFVLLLLPFLVLGMDWVFFWGTGLALAWSMVRLGAGYEAICARASKDIEQSFGIPDQAPAVEYEGGHPDLPNKCLVRVWSTSNHLFIASVVPLGKSKLVRIPAGDLVQLSLHSNVQHVNTGGGRSIGGAIVGGAIAGPVGAIVGGRSATKVETFDESKTYLFFRCNGVLMQVIFKGGPDTYNKLAPIIARLGARR